MTEKSYDRLMIFALDRLSDLLNKGEMTDRYYNPGNLFSHVDIVLCNDDQTDLKRLKKAVGDAKFTVHNLQFPRKLFLKSFAYQDIFMRELCQNLFKIVEAINPQLIRCHGTSLHTYLCKVIQEKYNIPYVVSMHINPDEDIFNREKNPLRRVQNWFLRRKIIQGLKYAKMAMPVYSPIADFLDKNKIENYKICYNVLNPSHIKPKTNYDIGDIIKVISVGRQIKEKDCSEIIRAISRMENVNYTLIGNGPMHQPMKDLADELGVSDRIHFIPAVPNDELCAMMKDYDIFATHTEYWEISKSVLEALLTGMPIILNKRTGAPVAELTSDICIHVDNHADDYEEAFYKIITDHDFREALGKKALSVANEKWHPDNTEPVFVEIYKQYALAS